MFTVEFDIFTVEYLLPVCLDMITSIQIKKIKITLPYYKMKRMIFSHTRLQELTQFLYIVLCCTIAEQALVVDMILLVDIISKTNHTT